MKSAIVKSVVSDSLSSRSMLPISNPLDANVANARLGPNCSVDPLVEVGYIYAEGCGAAQIGPRARIRRGAILYGDVVAGRDLAVGHFALIREHTSMGDQVMVGTQAVIEGHVDIGSYVKIESQAFISTHAQIGSFVFIGPKAALINDRYPLRQRDQYQPQGPVLEDHVSLGAGCIIMPGVRIGYNSMIAAGAVVTEDVPPKSLVVGAPGRVQELPEALCEKNRARSWNL